MAIDIVAGIIVFFLCWRAYSQGFARQLIQLTALALGICLAEPIAAKIGPWANDHIKAIPAPIQGPVIVLASLFIIWFVVSFVGSLMLASYRRSVYGDNLPSLGDRLFGVSVGFLKAAFFISLIIFGFDRLPESVHKVPLVEDQVTKSKSVKWVHDYKLVDRLVGTEEVQSLGKRVQQLVEYLRSDDPDAKPKDSVPADAGKSAVDRLVEQVGSLTKERS
jgi:uncharacterized membrane protein required for colicin V production